MTIEAITGADLDKWEKMFIQAGIEVNKLALKLEGEHNENG